jgi:hypothetical protein
MQHGESDVLNVVHVTGMTARVLSCGLVHVWVEGTSHNSSGFGVTDSTNESLHYLGGISSAERHIGSVSSTATPADIVQNCVVAEHF